jgi:hypothetical protein
MNYHDKKFKVANNSQNGEVDEEMVFHYRQEGKILSSDYSGADIIKGHLIALVDDNGIIEMRYHQVNKQGDIRTGRCKSRPEIMPNGKIKLHEEWEWLSGGEGKGTSTLIEI